MPSAVRFECVSSPPPLLHLLLQGAIILGIGGDNSNGAIGTFYEGVMTQGYSTDVSTRSSAFCRRCR